MMLVERKARVFVVVNKSDHVHRAELAQLQDCVAMEVSFMPRVADAHDEPTSLVYLVRHGRTALNAARRLRGRLDPPLDEVGRREARSLAKVFAEVPIMVVVSSPLGRAVDTATAIAGACGAEIEIDGRLMDRDYGEFAGHSRDEVEAEYGTLDGAPGVESTATLVERVWRGFDAVATRAVGGRAVIVAHDAINRCILHEILAGVRMERISQRTGCWNRVESRDGGTTWSATVVDAIPGDGHVP